jgi:hypothetical protein
LHVTTLVETSNGQKGALLGDANLDGTVNVLIDAATVVQNLGDTVTSWSDGDFNADQIVNVLGDAALLVNNLGQNNTTSVSPAASSVPEPTAGLLLAVTTIASCFRRRR